jgi:hypothetical protein
LRDVLGAAYPLTHAIDAERKRMRLLPDVKLFEVGHS